MEVHPVAACEWRIGHETGTDGREVDHVGDVGAPVGEGELRLDHGADAQVVARIGTGHEDAERVEEECERREGGDTDRGAGEGRGDGVDDSRVDQRERTDDPCSIDRDQRDHRQGKRGEGAEATGVRGAHAETGRDERGERIGVETVPAETHAVPEPEDG